MNAKVIGKREMLSNRLKDFTGKRVLLLQGPVGPFFYRFAKKLKKVGATVYKINFNGGDFIFYPFASLNYTKILKNFEPFLKEFCIKNEIDAIIIFNDCRPVHSVAKVVAKEMDINLGVFEEGYIRPDYVTFENEGVNGYSLIPKERSFYDRLEIVQEYKTKKLGNAYLTMALYAFCYWLGAFLLSWYFNNSLHHRSLSPLEVYPWIVSYFRKFKYLVSERDMKKRIRALPKCYFLAALQVYNDTQICSHFSGASVESFIESLIASFAEHSNSSDFLVIKHHPMDRGYRDYSTLIDNLSIQYGADSRVFYIHDAHLPTLLDKAIGCVVINSTVGISALHHNCPLKVCGNAFYDIEGLTYQGSINAFWKEAKMHKPDHKLYLKFKNYVVLKTQINGSFYLSSFFI